MRLLLASLLAAGCVQPNAVDCGDFVCPVNSACDMAHGRCVDPNSVSGCEGKNDRDPCALPSDPMGMQSGNCQVGVCEEIKCGNGVVDKGEVCDPPGATCSPTCDSDGSCGNKIVDHFTGETCDDGNFADHDGCTSACQTETTHWVQIADTPPARVFANMTYDAHRRRTVLFGGATGLNGVVDTWEWDGTWHEIATAPPPGRVFATLTYDAALGKDLLVGGIFGSSTLDEVWQWDGISWTQAQSLPVTIQNHGAAFDSKRQRLVVFGGQQNGALGNHIYELAGDTWSDVTPTSGAQPPPLFAPLVAYDPTRGVTVVYGGVIDPTTDPYTLSDDVWEWDGAAWTRHAKAGTWPAKRFAATLTFDPGLGKTVLVGGLCYADPSNPAVCAPAESAWTWNGTTWVKLAPMASAYAGAAAIDANDNLVVFGGETAATGGTASNTQEVLQPSPVKWISPSTPQPRFKSGVAQDYRHRRVYVFGGDIYNNQCDCDMSLGDLWQLDATGWHLLATTPPSGPAAAAGVGLFYDRARDALVLFGGQEDQGQFFYTDTWKWTGSAWTKLAPAHHPPNSIGSSFAYDAVRDREMMLFFDDPNTLDPQRQQWSWDGTDWTDESALLATGPSARSFAQVGYDEARDELVVFGGYDLARHVLGDTWVWSGATMTWTQLSPTTSPPARGGHSLVWDPSRRHLVLVGADTLTDTWQWDGDTKTWTPIRPIEPPTGRFEPLVFTALDGSGIDMLFGGVSTSTLPDRWQLRSDGPGFADVCEVAENLDGDALAGCADPDCWSVCTPTCFPGTSCDATAPHCGDGTCDAVENCQSCPSDCACVPVCGDFVCEAGETSATCPGDCP